MPWGRNLSSKFVATLFAIVLLGACETSRNAFAWLTGQVSISNENLPAGAVQENYRIALTAVGGSSPYHWSLRDGWLPAGLRLSEDGTLAGVPEVPGDFSFTASVADASAHSATKAFELHVAPRGLAIINSNPELPWGRMGSDYLVRFAASGGGKQYEWKAIGALPPGLKLRGDGVLAGQPSSGGDFTIAVQVSNAGQSAERKFSLHVSPTQLDAFGGALSLPSPHGASGRWRTEKIGNRWVFVTPAGNAFWMIGVWGVTGDSHVDERGGQYDTRAQAKYGNLAAVNLQANRRLKSWGFNLVGPWSYRMVLPIDEEPEWGGAQPVKFPYTTRSLNSSGLGREHGLFKNIFARLDGSAARDISTSANFPDVFDPAWVGNTYQQYASDEDLIRKSKSPYYVGSFADDTDDLGGFGPGPDFQTDPPDKTHAHLGYVVLVTSPVQYVNPYSTPQGQRYLDQRVYTKYALRDYLKAKYGSIAALNAAWNSDYTTFDNDGSWPTGRGLLDENGRSSHKWLGNGNSELPSNSGANPNMVADLNEFMYRMAKQYLTVHRDALKRVAPNALFFGPTSIGGWFAPARAPLYRAAGETQDIVSVTTDGSQEQLDYITRAVGDVPLIIWEGMTANPDSSRWRHKDSDVASASWYVKTQGERAQRYRQRLDTLFSRTSKVTGSKPYVGMLWWWWLDMVGEQKNWGLVSLMDNAYDGMEATRAPGVDAWGYRTGGEEKNYGDFIHPAREMNFSIMDRLAAGK
jgi:hypothetical protein